MERLEKQPPPAEYTHSQPPFIFGRVLGFLRAHIPLAGTTGLG
jgi:hypothetical protein